MVQFALALSFILLASACGYDAGPPLDASLAAASDASPAADASQVADSGAGRDGPPRADGGAIPACSNGIDDDCDGLVDHAGGDPGCAAASDADERGPGLVCDDGIDNDGDQLTDYVAPECGGGDPECASPLDTTELATPGPT